MEKYKVLSSGSFKKIGFFSTNNKGANCIASASTKEDITLDELYEVAELLIETEYATPQFFVYNIFIGKKQIELFQRLKTPKQ